MDSRLREVDAPAEPANGAAALATAKAEVEVTKPRNDRRGYRRVVLPNALECLLISDPDTDKVSSSRSLALQSGRVGVLWQLLGFVQILKFAICLQA
uniref:Uncharacterized protein n=1 Tax=Aegilops tauschii subsp. strangulata TaxID=200361 RepID=A0A453B8R1_AEGTS